MTEARIPFGNLQASGIEELSGGMPVAMNVVSDGGGTIRKRPGLTSYFSSIVNANGISCLYETTAGEVYAVAGTVPSRNIFQIKSTGAIQLHAASQADVPGTDRPTVAETDALLVFAGGRNPEKLVLSTKMPSRLGGGPPQGSHVIAMRSSLMLNDVRGNTPGSFYFSAPTTSSADYSPNEDWTTPQLTGSVKAEARPDPIVALHDNTDEIFAFGTTTLQVFAPSQDPTYPFQPSVTRELGCGAPYSVIKTDQSFAWLDHLRRFVISDGRSQTVISDPIQKTLHDMTTVSDCFGYRVVQGYMDILVWTFPTDGRTFAFQQGASWSEWSGWDGDSWTVFPVTAATKLKAQGKTLVGTSTGQMATLQLDSPTDFGSTINSYIITGFQDHDTDSWKSCDQVRLALRRGQVATGAPEPFVLLSYRDNLGPWNDPIAVGLGTAADYDPVVELWGMGVYRRRQWKLEFTNAADMSLVAATESFSVLPGDG